VVHSQIALNQQIAARGPRQRIRVLHVEDHRGAHFNVVLLRFCHRCVVLGAHFIVDLLAQRLRCARRAYARLIVLDVQLLVVWVVIHIQPTPTSSAALASPPRWM